MNRGRLILLAIAIVIVAAATTHAAESTATDAERSYLELRKSKDRGAQLLAERWGSVIGIQEWTDKTGEHKTTAKYVEHDPGLTWVKLRVTQGTGEKRVVKDVQVPLEKLGKTSQSRVRQIATLKEKVAAAIAADKEKDKEGKVGMDSGARGEAAAAMPERGVEQAGAEGEARGEQRGRGEERGLSEERGRSEVAPTESTQRIEAPASTTPSADGPPPMLIPREVDAAGATPVTPSPDGVAQSPAAPTAELNPNSQPMPDNEPWRTDYEAFRSKVSMETDRLGLTRVNWGPIPALQAAYDQLMSAERTGSVSAEQSEAVRKKLEEAGEFTWETTLTDAPIVGDDWTPRIGLPTLSEPLRIGFFLDPERDPGPWQNLKPGDRVRFIGRFYFFDDDASVTVMIRITADQPAATSAPPIDRR